MHKPFIVAAAFATLGLMTGTAFATLTPEETSDVDYIRTEATYVSAEASAILNESGQNSYNVSRATTIRNNAQQTIADATAILNEG